MEVIASSYATALFDIAREENKMAEYKKDLDFALSCMDEENLHFFSSALIEKESRLALIDQCFKGTLQENTVNLMKLLVVKGRMRYFKDIVKAYTSIYYESEGIVEGIVYTTVPLSDEEIKTIADAIGKREGKTLYLTCQIDESLLGGAKVVINDRVYDGSVKNKLATLKSELLKGSR